MVGFFRVDFLNKEALQSLKKYKYVSGDYSLLDNLLNPFWIRVTESFPMWLAPNTVTLTGLVGMILIVLRLISEDVTMTQKLGSYDYYVAAMSIFIYQTLDACDGKQARRTGSSSPLG